MLTGGKYGTLIDTGIYRSSTLCEASHKADYAQSSIM